VTEPRTGWNKPRPEHIPESTPWPLGMAAGITLFAWGFITSPIVLGAGFLLMVVSLFYWIGELRHE
jgi:hypothetical protein